jgi:hypothetical protein
MGRVFATSIFKSINLLLEKNWSLVHSRHKNLSVSFLVVSIKVVDLLLKLFKSMFSTIFSPIIIWGNILVIAKFLRHQIFNKVFKPLLSCIITP